jgi:hypothetical protein
MVAGNQRRVNRTDGRADHPVWLLATFMQGLVDTEMKRPHSATALHDHHGLLRWANGV